ARGRLGTRLARAEAVERLAAAQDHPARAFLRAARGEIEARLDDPRVALDGVRPRDGVVFLGGELQVLEGVARLLVGRGKAEPLRQLRQDVEVRQRIAQRALRL